MNITWLQLKPIVRELKLIRAELSRLADCWEAELAENGLHMKPAQTQTGGEEPTVAYVDEGEDWLREQMENVKPRVSSGNGPETLP